MVVMQFKGHTFKNTNFYQSEPKRKMMELILQMDLQRELLTHSQIRSIDMYVT